MWSSTRPDSPGSTAASRTRKKRDANLNQPLNLARGRRSWERGSSASHRLCVRYDRRPVHRAHRSTRSRSTVGRSEGQAWRHGRPGLDLADLLGIRSRAAREELRLSSGSNPPRPARNCSARRIRSRTSYGPDVARGGRGTAEQGRSGLWHLAGPEVMDRVAFTRRIAEGFGLDPASIVGKTTAELGQTAPRPLQGGLLSPASTPASPARSTACRGGSPTFASASPRAAGPTRSRSERIGRSDFGQTKLDFRGFLARLKSDLLHLAKHDKKSLSLWD